VRPVAASNLSRVQLHFTAIAEPFPGDVFAARFRTMWPALREWFLRDGDAARPSYAAAQRALHSHVPELVPVWERMVELAGGGDVAARMLSLYDPPPLMAGCSQAVIHGSLVRNYDYHPAKLEGTVLRSELTGRAVLGSSDCLWGLLDGINDQGLTAALAFGGRPVHEPGFGITLIVRYLLETCTTVAEALATLRRVPVNAPYNLTLADAYGEAVTAYLGPDRAVGVSAAIATNHQEHVEWEDYGRATRTLERYAALRSAHVDDFLAPPLYATEYERGFGTLYTAIYTPATRSLVYRWPHAHWELSLDAFTEGARSVTLTDGGPG
jgi:predicted choloylglycine hydrolase